MNLSPPTTNNYMYHQTTTNCVFLPTYLIRKSLSLNSYGILKPKFRNFLLSINKEWNQHKQNSKGLYLLFFSHRSYRSFDTKLIMRVRLARKPEGGSVVILTPHCKIIIGKRGSGLVDNHKRNAGLV